MRKTKIFLSVLCCLIAVFLIPVNALAEEDYGIAPVSIFDRVSPYSKFTTYLSTKNAGTFTSEVETYDYYFLTLTTSSTGAFMPKLFCVDNQDESPASRAYAYYSPTLNDSKFFGGTKSLFSITTNYKWRAFYTAESTLDENFSFTLSSSILSTNSSLAKDFDRLIFDEKNTLDDFPWLGTEHEGESSYGTRVIIACNVDIYDYNGDLLQKGDTAKLIEYCPFLKSANINDYVEKEPATEPSSDSGGGGSSGDDDDNKASWNILGVVKDIFENIKGIPDKIGEFFTTVGDKIIEAVNSIKEGIISGLEFLFVPSDNLFDDIQNILTQKFAFYKQILEVRDFITNIDFKDTPPAVKFDLNKLKFSLLGFQPNFGSGEVTIIDFQWLEERGYIDLIRGLILAVLWATFLRKLPDKVVNTINGTTGGDS